LLEVSQIMFKREAKYFCPTCNQLPYQWAANETCGASN
jgi:hypothetical protein